MAGAPPAGPPPGPAGYNETSHSPKQGAESLKKTIHMICFWKFGLQCPTSRLLPPRKDPLEDFDGYRSSANTHPHKQHLYGLLDSTNAHQTQL
ncbi:hypothetical protein F511_06133 [Dorcoceras hygrometricum]|uniref:Uncharacterized protein n=1 Tax=Dorcoceras hygrometricum TaxID=472368 RepID=A0A2Z7BHF3_9LAMI|nr:hypothetical protein F511_06133 [Dorcoceras hygrometricum]